MLQRRYGCRAMMLETVAAVPGMVGGLLLHCKSLRRFEQSGGWIKALLEEAENERMHLMTFMEVSDPRWYERALVLTSWAISSLRNLLTVWWVTSRRRQYTRTPSSSRNSTRAPSRTCRLRPLPLITGSCRRTQPYAMLSWL